MKATISKDCEKFLKLLQKCDDTQKNKIIRICNKKGNKKL